MKKNNRKIFEKFLFGIPLSIIFVSFLIILFKGQLNFGTVNLENLGGYGSFIGGIVGTFLTIIATYYVYRTYHSQKNELKSQKKELQLQRQLIAQQQFESTFFNMLNVHRELKNSLKMNRKTPKFSGMDFTNIENEKLVGLEVIEEVNNYFLNYYNKITKRRMQINEIFEDNKFTVIDFQLEQDLKDYDILIKKNGSEKNILDFIFKKIFEKFQDEIGHYCRNVYHILKFIRENEKYANDLSFRKYADIFQLQLNVNEQFLLFYNFIIFDRNDNEKYLHPIELVNHYKFLENLGHKNLLDYDLHNNKKFYDFDIK